MSKRPSKNIALVCALILGGALSNFLDRFTRGAVIDFLDVHLMGFHWPAFNFADTTIVLGEFILIFNEYTLLKRNSK